MNVLLSGSRGLIGSAVYDALTARGDTVTRLLSKGAENGAITWNAIRQGRTELLEGYDAIVHLGGANIGERRWTFLQRQRIWDSRIVTTDVLAQSIRELSQPPSVFVCASAVGYYGNAGDQELDEEHPSGRGFLADLCKKWEELAKSAESKSTRVVSLRTGVVQAAHGGALKRQVPLYLLAMGGRMSKGTQWVSWIHLEDAVRAIIHSIDCDQLRGPVNITSPQPIQQIDQNWVLSHVVHRPALIPIQKWMLYLALGKRFSEQMLLASARVFPKKLLESGFVFHYPSYVDAIVHLIRPEQRDEIQMLKTELAAFRVKRLRKGTRS